MPTLRNTLYISRSINSWVWISLTLAMYVLLLRWHWTLFLCTCGFMPSYQSCKLSQTEQFLMHRAAKGSESFLSDTPFLEISFLFAQLNYNTYSTLNDNWITAKVWKLSICAPVTKHTSWGEGTKQKDHILPWMGTSWHLILLTFDLNLLNFSSTTPLVVLMYHYLSKTLINYNPKIEKRLLIF